jgi:glutamyl-tRNA synthetase
LALSAAEIAEYESDGRRPHWRFLLPNFASDPQEPERTEIHWNDLVRGEETVDLASVSDPVLVREDGTYLYTLPSVVDDIDFAITHVIRGEDHVANTGVQIQLFEALGSAPPAFAHHNLLIGADGQALSKRLGSLSIRSLREEGLEPPAVLSHSATIGTSNAVAPYKSLTALAEIFGFGKLSRASARFDIEELRALNARLLHELEYSEVASRLEALGIEGGQAFWDAVRPNLRIFGDVAKWWRVVAGPIEPEIHSADLLTSAREMLPREPWSQSTWHEWTEAIKAATGAKGKALFQPLRLALTGYEHGPDLKMLLPLIGREKAAARLAGIPHGK